MLKKYLVAFAAALIVTGGISAPALAQAPVVSGPTPPPFLSDGSLAKNPTRVRPDSLATNGINAKKNLPGAVAAKSTQRSAVATVSPYYYAGGRQTLPAASTVNGVGVNVTVANPPRTSTEDHTLAEIAMIYNGCPSGSTSACVPASNPRQIVEAGWIVQGTNPQPTLFVYRWVNGQASCYNACGFVNYGGATILPGSQLTAGVTKEFDVSYFQNAWWVSFDHSWVGYYPETLWTSAGVGSFNKITQLQMFGEVFGDPANPSTPCSNMGNGLLPSDTLAARFSSATYQVNAVNETTSTMNLEAFRAGYADSAGKYEATLVTNRTVRYGGPGFC